MNIEEHLLTCLAEECAETQKIICKALRFGLDDHHPDHPKAATNRTRLEREIAHIVAAIEMLHEGGVISDPCRASWIGDKKRAVKRYMEYARERGTLTGGS